jgi:uncharacterized membrane protein YfcA
MFDKVVDLLIPDFDTNIVFMIMITFYIAGVVKGFLGIGLPAAAMALLTLFINPLDAIALIIVPIIFTNALQFLRSKKRKQVIIEYKYCAIALIITIFVTSMFIKSYPSALITISIGIAMVAFSINTLVGVKLLIGPKYGWQITTGIVSGILGGLSSIWSPPIAMYLLAREVSKEKFIAATGFLFLVGSFPLALGYYISGILTINIILKSLVGLIVVLTGFRTGEVLRERVPQGIFKKFVLWSFMIMGLRLIATGFLSS